MSYLAEGQMNALDLPTSMKLGASGGGQAALVTRSYWGLDRIAYPDAIPCPLGTPKQILASGLLDLSYAYQVTLDEDDAPRTVKRRLTMAATKSKSGLRYRRSEAGVIRFEVL